MLRKKSIVLSDAQNKTNKKAVLSLEQDHGGLCGTVRLYNFSSEPNGVCSLGFYVNKNIYKAGMTKKANMLYEFYLDLQDIPNVFSCAVVNFQNAEPQPILYGASNGSDDEIYSEIITNLTKNSSIQNVKNTLDDYGVDFDDDEKEIVEKEIDKAMCEDCSACEKCVYKKYFYENAPQNSTLAQNLASNGSSKSTGFQTRSYQENLRAENDKNREDFSANLGAKSREENSLKQNENLSGEKGFQERSSELDLEKDYRDENSDKSDEPKRPAFVEKLKPQIDKLFEKNPTEENLQKLIPHSKWAKIEYEDDGDFYVFGIMYDENSQPKYVCYGVPAVYEEEAPKELSGFPIWLPLDKQNEKGFGYWLTYQDAVTGEPIKAVIE